MSSCERYSDADVVGGSQQKIKEIFINRYATVCTKNYVKKKNIFEYILYAVNNNFNEI